LVQSLSSISRLLEISRLFNSIIGIFINSISFFPNRKQSLRHISFKVLRLGENILLLISANPFEVMFGLCDNESIRKEERDALPNINLSSSSLSDSLSSFNVCITEDELANVVESARACAGVIWMSANSSAIIFGKLIPSSTTAGTCKPELHNFKVLSLRLTNCFFSIDLLFVWV